MRQPLRFQLPSVFNSKSIKVILFHIDRAAHSDKKKPLQWRQSLEKSQRKSILAASSSYERKIFFGDFVERETITLAPK